MGVANGTDLIQFCRGSIQVRRQYAFAVGIFGKGLLQRTGIHVPGLPFALNEHLFPALIADGVYRGRKGQVGTEHLVPRLYSRQFYRQMQGGSPGVQRRGVFYADILGHSLFKFIYIFPQRGHPISIKGLLYIFLLLPVHGG